MSQNRAARGFTLIELLVVISIIALLVALLLPAVQQARESARSTQCRSNLKQLTLALHSYHTAHRCLPPGTTHDDWNPATDSTFWSWIGQILPFIEQEPLYKSIDFKGNPWPTPNAANLTVVKQPLRFLKCPTSTRPVIGTDNYATTEYLGSAGGMGRGWSGTVDANFCASKTSNPNGNSGIFYGNSAVTMDDIRDGTGTTLAIGERPPPEDLGWGWWTGPGATNWCPNGNQDVILTSEDVFGLGGLRASSSTDPNPTTHWWSFHSSGAHFSFADGRVTFLSYSMDHTTLVRMSTRAGGEIVDDKY